MPEGGVPSTLVDEHVHSCCVLDDTLAESVPSRIMMVTLMMILQYSHFDVVFSLFCHSLQLILIVTITCSTDLDDSPDIPRVLCCRSFLVMVQPTCLSEHGAHGKRSGKYLLFVEAFLQEWTGSISELE